MRALFPALFVLSMGLAAPQAAWAQDDDDLFADEEEDDDFFGDEEEPASEGDEDRLEEGDTDLLGDEDEEELEDFSDIEDEEDSIDLLGDDTDATQGDSGDSAATYRQQQADMKNKSPDEEVGAWEAYLAQYPTTPFRDKIQRRIDELMAILYDARIESGGGEVDAMQQQLKFGQPMQLEGINPRTRLQAGFEMGLPRYLNLLLDYENAFRRNLSGHIGVRQRYTGFNIEAGTHWALVKSTRTNTLLTFIGDVHFNATPSWVGIRPQLAFGKVIGKLEAQLQGGVDFEMQNPLGMRVIGGFSGNYRASDTVGIFVESGVNMKNFSWEGSVFTFNTVTFGMKFFPKKNNGVVDDAIEVNMGATAPYATNYWAYHYGSVMGQVNYYMD